MSNYWDIVPKGCWTVKDPTDAKEALTDPESRFIFDDYDRITVLGPKGKCIIIDLLAIEQFLGSEKYNEFLQLVVRGIL